MTAQGIAGATPGGGTVTSVNGHVGAVVLGASDVGAAATSHTHAGADIASGTVAYARLPVGQVANTVAAGDDARFGTGGTAYDPGALQMGMLAATMPLSSVRNTLNLSAGTCVFVLCPIVADLTLATLECWIQTAGVTASGVNGLAAYTEAGVLIQKTGDLSTAFAGLGWKGGALAAGAVLGKGTRIYLSALTHYSGTTPKIGGALSDLGSGTNFPTINARYPSVFLTGQTDFPASFDPSTANVNSGQYLIAGR